MQPTIIPARALRLSCELDDCCGAGIGMIDVDEGFGVFVTLGVMGRGCRSSKRALTAGDDHEDGYLLLLENLLVFNGDRYKSPFPRFQKKKKTIIWLTCCYNTVG